jgi:hypothetical protein
MAVFRTKRLFEVRGGFADAVGDRRRSRSPPRGGDALDARLVRSRRSVERA